MLKLANRLTIAGLACVALAVTGAVILITDFLYGMVPTVIAASLIFLMALLLWFVIPLRVRRRHG